MKTPKVLTLSLAALAFAAVMALGRAVLAQGDPTKTPPATEQAEPAIDPAKLAGDPALRVQDARNRETSLNNLKQLGIAVHNYESTHRRLPGDVVGKDGKPLLSWRVRLLPFIEQQDLYKEFKLDEPWDSKHNLPLLEKMPKLLQSPRVSLKQKGYTVYQGFSGPNAVFRPGQPPRTLAAFPDGTSNTLLAVESSAAVPWTKPTDIPFDRAKAVPDFGKALGGRPLAVLGDGSVRTLDLKKISAETLKNLIDPADGNVLGDW